MNLDGIVLALAGVRRLGLEERVTEIIPRTFPSRRSDRGALGLRQEWMTRKWRGKSDFSTIETHPSP